MSWDAYMPSLCNGNIIGGGIFGKDKSTWTSSENFKLTQECIDTLNKCCDENCHAHQSSVVIDGDKYMNTTPPNEKGYVRMTGPVNREGPKNLLYGMPTAKGLVVAITDTDNSNRAALLNNVQYVANYLTTQGY